MNDDADQWREPNSQEDDIVAEDNQTPEPDPVVEPTVELPTNAAMQSWKNQFGEELKYENDKEFFEDVAQIIHSTPSQEDLDRYRHLEQMEPQVLEYLNKREEIEKWQASQVSAEQKTSSEVPKLSETAQILINQGKISIDSATGLYQSDDPHATPYVKSANDFRAHRQQMSDRLLADPFTVVKEAGLGQWQEDFEKTVNERFEKMIDERFASYGAKDKLAVAERTLSDGMHMVDESGKVLLDSSGKPQPNEKGVAHRMAMSEAAELLEVEYGKASDADKIKMLKFADKKADSVSVASPTEEPAEELPPTKKQKQDKFVESANSNGRRSRLANSDTSVAAAAALAEVSPTVDYRDLYDQISQQG